MGAMGTMRTASTSDKVFCWHKRSGPFAGCLSIERVYKSTYHTGPGGSLIPCPPQNPFPADKSSKHSLVALTTTSPILSISSSVQTKAGASISDSPL